MNQDPSDHVDWEHQRAFLAVYRTGSLSAAARTLRTTQPTVRRRIDELEHQIGTALFTRSQSGLLRTALAHELAAHVQTMEASAVSFMRAATAEAGSATGVVRITASEMIGVEVLPDILRELRVRHPGLLIQLGLNNRVEDLLTREADIAIRMLPTAAYGLMGRHVGDVRIGLYCHKRLLVDRELPTSREELRRFPLIGFETETTTYRMLQSRDFNFPRDQCSFWTDSNVAQVAAIRAGLGIGACQMGIAAHYPDLLRILPDLYDATLQAWVVMHQDLKAVHRVKLVFDALVHAIAAYASH